MQVRMFLGISFQTTILSENKAAKSKNAVQLEFSAHTGFNLCALC